MLDAVETWYSEKESYLQHVSYLENNSNVDTDKQWGHYNTLIMNQWKTIGLTTYKNSLVDLTYVTAGEFTAKQDIIINDIIEINDDSSENKYDSKNINSNSLNDTLENDSSIKKIFLVIQNKNLSNFRLN